MLLFACEQFLIGFNLNYNKKMKIYIYLKTIVIIHY
jgi:hypothetical protein